MYNNMYGSKKDFVVFLGNSNAPSTTCSNCIPVPTPISGQRN